MKTLILASRAKDNIYENGNFMETKKAGPAYYLTRQLDRLHHKYDLAKNLSAEVNIFVNDNGETGKIIRKDKVYVPDDIYTYKNCIISTISPNSIELDKLDRFAGTIFLDIQGFLRGPIEETTPLLKTLCGFKYLKYIKGTTEEIEKLKNAVGQKTLRTKIIIETMGRKGVKVRENGKEQNYEIIKVINTPNTIGAGDTFLAVFANEIIIKKATVQKAINTAIESTCALLAQR